MRQRSVSVLMHVNAEAARVHHDGVRLIGM